MFPSGTRLFFPEEEGSDKHNLLLRGEDFLLGFFLGSGD
jgi:hypothetical protein